MDKGILENLYHVAIAVRDIEQMEKVYEGSLGLRVEHREVVQDQGGQDLDARARQRRHRN